MRREIIIEEMKPHPLEVYLYFEFRGIKDHVQVRRFITYHDVIGWYRPWIEYARLWVDEFRLNKIKA